MTVFLPTLPTPSQQIPQLIPNAWINKGALGGMDQRVMRPGDKFSLQVQARSMSYPQGQAYLSTLLQGVTSLVAYRFPIYYTVGNPGSIVVNGNGQAGTNLNIRGVTAGYNFQVGQWFTLLSQGRRTLHFLTAATGVSGGTATIAFLPMLRTVPSDGDTLDFATPVIEGYLSGNQSWNISAVTSIGLSFTITEA